MCRKLTEWEGNPYRPFCSKRCSLIDLGKWIEEEYRVPVVEREEERDEEKE